MSASSARQLLSPAAVSSGLISLGAVWVAVLWAGEQFVAPTVVSLGLAGAVMRLVERHRQATASATADRERLIDERSAVEGVIDQLPIGVVVVEAESGIVLRVNPLVADLLDQPLAPGSPSSSVMQGIAFTADGEPAASIDALVEQTRTTGTTVIDERYVIRGDGSCHPMVVAAVPLRERRRGQPLGLIVLVDQDLQRPEDQRWRRLRSAANASAALAHEVGNQLTAVVCFLELLNSTRQLEAGARAHAQEALTSATAAADQARRLVETAASLRDGGAARLANRHHQV